MTDTPLVSVIIPAHNGGELLQLAIRSALDQTYPRCEVIVVDDASTEDTPAIVAGIGSPGVTCIRHTANRGAQAARHTGVQAAKGDILAFLDQDDLFHRDKIAKHVAFLQEHPETGLTYNSHFTLLHPAQAVVGIWRPPEHVTLEDLVRGFPIVPSAWVMRREWADREEIFDAGAMLRGAETLIFGRLLVSGCRFSLVDRALNYRRVTLDRRYADPAGKCREERRCQEIMIEDPRSPAGLAAIRNAAAAENCLVWACVALAQSETETGVALLREALQLDPSAKAGRPSRIVQLFVSHAIRTSSDAAARLRAIWAQLPPDLAGLAGEADWAVREAHLIAGAQHAIWNRPAAAADEFRRAAALGRSFDGYFLGRTCHELSCYAHEFGPQAEAEALRRLADGLAVVSRIGARRMRGAYELASAFRSYREGRRGDVPAQVIRAFVQDGAALGNRGAWSILLRSTLTRHRTVGRTA